MIFRVPRVTRDRRLIERPIIGRLGDYRIESCTSGLCQFESLRFENVCVINVIGNRGSEIFSEIRALLHYPATLRDYHKSRPKPIGFFTYTT